MPANIAHMLICHKAIYKVKEKNISEYSDFISLLDNDAPGNNLRAYMNLGSLGPDLFYYSELTKSAIDMFRDGYLMSRGVEPWSYHLHSVRPNEFPLRLIEITFRDAIKKGKSFCLEFEDYARLAFIAGYLTHIAVDQIIHPIVNQVAGPYYRSGDSRKIHRECEVFQDYFVYEGIYRMEGKIGTKGDKYDFFKQDFNNWADCIPGDTFKNTEDWFRYFIQRGFAETYNLFPSEKTIENAVDNILLTLKICNHIGPYKSAAKDLIEKKDSSKKFQKFIKEIDYFKYFDIAVELAALYLLALYEVFALLSSNCDFSHKQAKRFTNIVSSADLSCPLERNILKKAVRSFKSTTLIDPALDSLKMKIKNINFLSPE